MSDYVRIKAIRYPITREEIVTSWNFDDEQADEITRALEKWNNSLFDYDTVGKFTITSTNDGWFLDYLLDYEYGADGENLKQVMLAQEI